MERRFSKKDSMTAKGLAILLLLFYHLFYEEHVIMQMQVNHGPIPKDIFLMGAGFGNICVAIFVMITAYGITKSILEVPGMSMKAAYEQAVGRFIKLMGGFAVLYISAIVVWSKEFNLQSLYGHGKQGVILMLCDGLGIAQVLGTPTLNETWWYMALAYTFIFLIPLLAFCVQKIGTALLPMAFFLPMVITLNSDMSRYLFVAVFGVCAAHGGWFDKVLNLRLHVVWKWCIGLAGFVLCVLVRQNAVVKDYLADYADAPIAFFLICFAIMLPGSIPGIKQILDFIGKHSMNIYLVHTFFYLILYRDFVYGFGHAGIIFVVLVIVSLMYAVILDAVRALVVRGANVFHRIWEDKRKKM